MRETCLLTCMSVALVVTLACRETGPPVETAPIANGTAVNSSDQFVGAWALASIDRRDAAGELTVPSIEDRFGYIIYDASGYMGVTIMRPDRVPYSENGPTADEALAQFGTYTAYFGRFTVNEAEGYVTHHLEGSLNPSGAGSDYKRFYTLTEDSLILQPPARPDGSTAFLTWERLPDLPVSEVTNTHRQLVGAYRVDSVSRYTADGYSLPAEQYETGYILYAESGHMSVHLMRPGRLPYAGEQPTAEEALMVTETYGSYFGPFSVHEIVGCITCPGPRDEGYLIHHRVGNEDPRYSGTDARRYYELTDTHLTLRPPVRTDDDGQQVQPVIRWIRLVP